MQFSQWPRCPVSVVTRHSTWDPQWQCAAILDLFRSIPPVPLHSPHPSNLTTSSGPAPWSSTMAVIPPTAILRMSAIFRNPLTTPVDAMVHQESPLPALSMSSLTLSLNMPTTQENLHRLFQPEPTSRAAPSLEEIRTSVVVLEGPTSKMAVPGSPWHTLELRAKRNQKHKRVF